MTLVEFSEVLRNLFLAGVAGVGLLLAWRRIGPAVDQAAASREQARLAQMGEERKSFREAAEDLSSEAMAVRLAAVYVLRETALDVPRFADPAFAVMLAYVRDKLDAVGEGADVTPDVSAALDVIADLQKRRDPDGTGEPR